MKTIINYTLVSLLLDIIIINEKHCDNNNLDCDNITILKQLQS